jgi:cobalt-zinc-cadmium efflux system outer membrane protein
MLRTLRYQLRTTFYDLYFKQQTIRVYDQEIASFRRTVSLYQGQYDKGNIALKEVIRLKAFLFQLENERQALLAAMAEEQTDLHVLLRDETATSFRPVTSVENLRRLSLGGISEQQATDSALVARADVKARQAAVQQQTQNLRLQRALATPDLALGYTYDRAGSYIPNYHAVTVGVAVPIFNRNQGNIRTAQAQIEGSKAQLSQQQVQVQAEVRQAYQLARQTDELFQSTDPNTGDFDRLITGIEQSFAKRNLTIVEFLDFYESYKTNLVQLNELRASRVRAFEQLNYAVGRPLFRVD